MVSLNVTVVQCAGPHQAREQALALPPSATVMDALRATGWFNGEDATLDALSVGVWGRKCTPQQALREGDRVEIYRPLTVDPKVARRERFQRQGARTAGLFNRRRPGAKPGY